jgi:hypothetical protein
MKLAGLILCLPVMVARKRVDILLRLLMDLSSLFCTSS